MASTDFRIIIVGAGVSGLTTALALHRLGLRADIYERNSVITDLGAGIAIGPNAAHILQELGVEHELDKVSSRPQDRINLVYREHINSDVKFIGRLNTDRRSFYCHRAKLVQTIAKFIPTDQIHLGKTLKEIFQDDTSVTVRFDDNTSATGTVLIGADGIRSHIRSSYNRDDPIFSGQLVVRNIVKAEAIPAKLTDCLIHGQIWLAPGKRHVVTFPIDQGRSVAIGAIIPALPGYDWKETWKIEGDVDFQESLEVFDAPVRELFKCSDSQTVFGLYERSPLTSWTHGRIVLVGDAAHAMLPHQGQGGSQAIEDGIILALSLAAAAKCPPAQLHHWLQCYQDARKTRADQAAKASHITGKAYDDLIFSEQGMEFLEDAYAWINENDLLNDFCGIAKQSPELRTHHTLLETLIIALK